MPHAQQPGQRRRLPARPGGPAQQPSCSGAAACLWGSSRARLATASSRLQWLCAQLPAPLHLVLFCACLSAPPLLPAPLPRPVPEQHHGLLRHSLVFAINHRDRHWQWQSRAASQQRLAQAGQACPARGRTPARHGRPAQGREILGWNARPESAHSMGSVRGMAQCKCGTLAEGRPEAAAATAQTALGKGTRRARRASDVEGKWNFARPRAPSGRKSWDRQQAWGPPAACAPARVRQPAGAPSG